MLLYSCKTSSGTFSLAIHINLVTEGELDVTISIATVHALVRPDVKKRLRRGALGGTR